MWWLFSTVGGDKYDHEEIGPIERRYRIDSSQPKTPKADTTIYYHHSLYIIHGDGSDPPTQTREIDTFHNTHHHPLLTDTRRW